MICDLSIKAHFGILIYLPAFIGFFLRTKSVLAKSEGVLGKQTKGSG